MKRLVFIWKVSHVFFRQMGLLSASFSCSSSSSTFSQQQLTFIIIIYIVIVIVTGGENLTNYKSWMIKDYRWLGKSLDNKPLTGHNWLQVTGDYKWPSVSSPYLCCLKMWHGANFCKSQITTINIFSYATNCNRS